MKNEDKIVEAFRKVKALGWVKSHRRNNTGIGKTFEDYMGVVENNVDGPDLFGFEIKSHREESSSFVTLFTKSPSFPKRGANARLKDKFGECYPNSQMKKLHTSMFADKFNTFMGKYSFRLIHDKVNKRICIGVYSLGGKILLDQSVYYTYDDIEKALKKKLRSLFYVKAKRQQSYDGSEEFFFDSAEIYTEPSLDDFFKMLDAGEIMYDIRMGAYQSGRYCGRPHDHGSGFRIKEADICKLYRNKIGVS